MKHGRGLYVRGCRCAACTKAQRDYMREWARQKNGYYDPPCRASCARCGEAFDARGSRKRFCSKRCQNAALRPSPMGAKRVALRRRAAKAARGTSSTWVWISGTCSECGEAFTRHGAASSFCSKRCSSKASNRRRRALESGALIGKAERFHIHERDDWTCHICGDPVNRLAVVPELDAPTLDHVVALAAGGVHDESNLKTAHFYCNSVKRELPLSAVA